MRRRVTETWKLKRLCTAFLLGYLAPLANVPASKAQRASARPIRVESQQVLVPVFVWDERRWNGVLRTNPTDLNAYHDIPIGGLSSKDFRIYEDGHEQTIDRVTPEEPAFRPVRDTDGQHYEYVTTGGRWIYPDIPVSEKVFKAMTWPTYTIAYTPPTSAEGSCHQLSVKIVNHPDAAAFVRGNYCKAIAAAVDPLNGTKFGQQMENELISRSNGGIELSLTGVTSFLDADGARVHIAIEFDAKKLRYELRFRAIGELHETIGMLARIYAKDGTIAARLSDFDCCDYDDGAGLDWLIVRNSHNNILFAPGRYETQVYLPAGEYNLQVVVSDGKDFGRAEMPLVVERLEQQLSVGSLCVARRARVTQHELQEVPTKRVGSYVPLLSKDFEVSAAVRSVFRKNEFFYYYFEVYDPRIPGPPDCAPGSACEVSLEAHIRIINARTGAVKKDQEPVNVWQYGKPGAPVIPVAGEIDIHSLPKGSYRLEVQATDAAGHATPWRAIPFRID